MQLTMKHKQLRESQNHKLLDNKSSVLTGSSSPRCYATVAAPACVLSNRACQNTNVCKSVGSGGNHSTIMVLQSFKLSGYKTSQELYGQCCSAYGGRTANVPVTLPRCPSSSWLQDRRCAHVTAVMRGGLLSPVSPLPIRTHRTRLMTSMHLRVRKQQCRSFIF